MSEQNNMCRPGFKRGDYVYIGYGTYKGFIGRYYSSSPVPYTEGYTNQSLIEVLIWDKSPVKIMPPSNSEMVVIHDSCYVKIDIEHLQAIYDDAIPNKEKEKTYEYPHVCTMITDDSIANIMSTIEKYLDAETMCGVANQVFRAKMTQIFDRVYEARSSAGMTLYDEIMRNITDEQLKKFDKELSDVFMTRVEQEILRTDHPEEGDQTFREWLRFALQENARQWIKEHKEEIDDLMRDSIQLAASHLCEDKLCEALGEQLGKILKEKF